MKLTKNHLSKVKVDQVYVVTTTITLCNDEDPTTELKSVTWFFLARIENNKYYELFAGKRLQTEEEAYDVDSIEFDMPYIVKADPLKDYLVDETEKEMDIQSLFDFITNLNVLNSVGEFNE